MTLNLDNTLDWDIEQDYIFDAQGQPIKGYKSIKNNTTGELLNIAKHSYTPVSNSQLLEKTHLIQQATDFKLEGFATFKGGKKVLAYLKNPDTKPLTGLSASNYLIIGNSHDSSTAFFSGLTNHIHRCENMFSQQNMQMRVHHTQDVNNRLDDMLETIDFFYDAEQQVYRQMEDFERVKIGERQKEDLVEDLLDFKMIDWPELSTRRKNKAEAIFESIERETGELGNNLFGLFNGVTHYTSNVLKSSTKLFGSPFGHAAELNRKTLNWCQNQLKNTPKANAHFLTEHF